MQLLDAVVDSIQNELIDIEKLEATQASNATQTTQHFPKKKRGRPSGSKNTKPRKRKVKTGNNII